LTERDDGESSESSFSKVNNMHEDVEGILPLLEAFCKKGDITSLSQFSNLIKGEGIKTLLYRTIEYRQVEVLKYLLTQTQKPG
jgi:hypothetical protein